MPAACGGVVAIAFVDDRVLVGAAEDHQPRQQRPPQLGVDSEAGHGLAAVEKAFEQPNVVFVDGVDGQ